jgi:hypothetical protein
MPRATTSKPWSVTLPRVLHHQGTGVLHHQGTGVLHHQGTGVLHHQGTGVLHHQGTGVLHHQGTGVLHHQGTGVLHHHVCCPSLLHLVSTTTVSSHYTEAPAYYTTKAVEYYNEAPKFYLPELRNYNCGGPVLLSTYLLHSGWSLILRWTEILLLSLQFTTPQTYAAPSY